MVPRVEYSVAVPVPVDAAFKAFQDLEHLLHRGISESAVHGAVTFIVKDALDTVTEICRVEPRK
jgi:hypothetical protein